MKILVLLLMFITTALSAAPQAVVFDFGGVMTVEHPDKETVVNFIRESLQLSPQEFETVNKEKRKALRLGTTDLEFWLSYSQVKGIALPCDWVEEFTEVLNKGLSTNPNMYALVEELRRKNVVVAMLSNIDGGRAKLIRSFGYYQPFKPTLLSCEIGVDKPDPKAFQILLDTLKLPAQDVIFIDDKTENVEAAKKLGIDAIHFVSEDQLRKELVNRGL
jgi:putative hydrolase of the HAD superfamily